MRIEAAPADAMYDDALTTLSLVDFPPRREVTLRAVSRDDAGNRWESWAAFVTDDRGGVDLAGTKPISGTYQVAERMGLFWSMRLDPAVEARGAFLKTGLAADHIALSAEVDGRVGATTELTRRYLGEGIVREDLNEEGLVGAFFHHRDEPRPAVLLVGGSGGGMSLAHPALLASRGFAVLSLAYFAMPGLPRELVEIPLEYFERAIAWLERHRAVNPGKPAVVGQSRGGELALLLGSTFPEVRAVVAYVPSGVVWAGLRSTPGPATTSWTHRGEPLAFMGAPVREEEWSRSPVVLTPSFLRALADRDEIERAAIPVERINGPVLMFSGTDDQMWPSLKLADLAMQRLIERNFPHQHEHISYAGAGHFIRYPYSPSITEMFHPQVKMAMALGGAPENNHVADLDSWRRCVAFLAQHLGGRS
jgi:dienelactone hydrolase